MTTRNFNLVDGYVYFNCDIQKYEDIRATFEWLSEDSLEIFGYEEWVLYVVTETGIHRGSRIVTTEEYNAILDKEAREAEEYAQHPELYTD